jgi:hypothetical protein
LLSALLELQSKQVRLRTADRRGAVAAAHVERLAAFVEGVDEVLTLVLVVAVFREAVWEAERLVHSVANAMSGSRAGITLDGALQSVSVLVDDGTERGQEVLTARR